MDRLGPFLTHHWFAVVPGAVAIVLAVLILVQHLQRRFSGATLLVGSALGLLSLGGLIVAPHLAWWIASGALAILFFMLLALLITGHWWAPAGYLVGAAALFALGGLSTESLSQSLVDAAKMLARLEAVEPWWLLLLALVPLIVLLSFRSLAGLGRVRRWVAIGLRSALIIFLVLALAEVRLRHENETVTVLFLVDRSLSMPEDPEDWERIKKFINDAVLLRKEPRDKAGVIVFGRRPRLELPPSNVKKLNFSEVASVIDANYTDIGAAIKLALASFPEGTARRIVLISDGNENLGSAEEQARLAKLNDVQIDVIPVVYRNENEVMVQSVEAPPVTEQSSQIPIRVLVRSLHPQMVEGTLTVKEFSEGQGVQVPSSPRRVALHPGLNSFTFKRSLTKQEKSYTYEATFQPDNLPGDRVQNNRATTHVIAMGRRRVLVIEPNIGDHQLLVDHLRRVGDSKFQVHTVTPGDMPQNKDEFQAFLSSYDCVILANVPASDVAPGDVPAERIPATITEEQQEVLRTNTYDQGCGLIMIGGPYGFGAGGWTGSPVEKALPVDCDIRSVKVRAKGGLVLVMHASEMAEGNRWQKDIAKLAVNKLSAQDMMGMLYYDWGQHKWHIPFKEIGGRKNAILRQIETMVPGDMPDVDPAFEKAYKELMTPSYELATKHVIFISDGDHWNADPRLLARMKNGKITVTTVCITTHGNTERQKMQAIATATGGRFYNVVNARALPQIYTKEVRLISQSLVSEKKFQPKLYERSTGPAAKLENLPPLYGFVRTSLKETPLVDMPIEGPSLPDQPFPILAYWHYGLGKSAAFTSDARSQPMKPAWDRDWAGSDMYYKFWEQLVDWAVRAAETGNMVMTTEYRDGKVKVTIDARDKNNRPLTDLVLRGRFTPPSLKPSDSRQNDLKFEQKSSGIYEAEFKADEAGSYFVNAQAVRKTKVTKNGKEVEIEEPTDSARAGVTIPYSPEFADMESNVPLLKKLAEMTGGRVFLEKPRQTIDGKPYPDYATVAEGTPDMLAVADAGDIFRRADLPPAKSLQPIWFWLLFLTGTLLFFDVAVRRIAIQPAEVAAAVEKGWQRLRGRAMAAETAPQFLERLKSRKAQVSEALDKARAARRFDVEEPVSTAGIPEASKEPIASPPSPRPVPKTKMEKEPEAEDYASRLLRAKKRVWQERDQDNK
jgi:uncharacterized membrane protein/Mg-chelatase subunit ChlD